MRERLAGQEENGILDLVAEISEPLPIELAAVMMDIQPGERDRVRKWARMIRSNLFRYDQTAEEVRAVEEELSSFADFVRSMISQKQRAANSDLISDLAEAYSEGLLSDDELLSLVLLLFINGLETLTSGLTMAAWELVTQPGAVDQIASDMRYAEAFFNEAMRFHGPVRLSARRLTAEISVDGYTFPQGAVVALYFAAANWDPSRFNRPETFDPLRNERHHLGFGHGIHYCLGAPLSVAAGATMLREIARHPRRLRTSLSPDELCWNPSLAFTTLTSLPLTA